MFGAHGNGSGNLLTKLVSLALSTRCAPVLFCVAIWMQVSLSEQFNSGASNCVVLFYLDVKVALFTRSNF